jgi:hypothetical protein
MSTNQTTDFGLTEPPDLHPYWRERIETLSRQLADAQLRLGCVEGEQPGLIDAAYRRFVTSLVGIQREASI